MLYASAKEGFTPEGLTWGLFTPGAPCCRHASGSLSLRSVPRDAICGKSLFRTLTSRWQSLQAVLPGTHP